jgi:hypothetical protein
MPGKNGRQKMPPIGKSHPEGRPGKTLVPTKSV